MVEIFKVGVRSKDKNNQFLSEDDRIRLPIEVLNLKDDKGRTTVHHAVSVLCMPILKRLIKMDAELDLQDKNGNTPLHVAVQKPDCLGETNKLINE